MRHSTGIFLLYISSHKSQDAGVRFARHLQHLALSAGVRVDRSCNPLPVSLRSVLVTDSVTYAFIYTQLIFGCISGRKGVYGRTDLGKKGMHNFFKTHNCGELCRMLRRKWVPCKIPSDLSRASDQASHVDANDFG